MRRDLVQNGVLLAEKVTNVHRQLARFVKTVRAENAAFWLAMCCDGGHADDNGALSLKFHRWCRWWQVVGGRPLVGGG